MGSARGVAPEASTPVRSLTPVIQLAIWLRDHDVRLGELRAGRQSLEEVFLRLTTEGRS